MAKIYTHKSFHPEASDLNHEAYLRGCEYFNEGNFTLAAEAYRTALEYWPQDADAWMALGDCEDELGNPPLAEKCFRNALKFCSDDDRGDIMYNLGNALLDQGDNQGAIECYEVVSASASSYERAQKNLVEAKLRMEYED